MMLTLEVATPLGLALRTEAEWVQAPSVRGEFGVLPGHLPLLAALKPGLLKYRAGGKDQVAAIRQGFVQADPDRVLVLTQELVQPADIDEKVARQELASTEDKLRAHKGATEDADYKELEHDLAWSVAKLEAIIAAQK